MNFFIAQKLLGRLIKNSCSQLRLISNVQQRITQSYYFMPGDTVLSSLRLGDLLDQSADKCGDHTAIISAYQGISKKYSKFKYEADKLASGFLSLGLTKGDRIAICSPNCYEWPLVQFAAAKAGLILVNLNPALQAMEIKYCLKKVNCKAIVTWDILKTQNFYNILCEIAPELPTSSLGKLQSKDLPDLEIAIMISENKKDGVFPLKYVMESGNLESDEKLSQIQKSIQFDDPVNIQFTSGTTGFPKGATLSHHNVINNALIGGRRVGYHLQRPIMCCHLPLFHSFGCVQASICSTLFQGTCIFPSPTFDASASLKTIEEYKCTTVYGTPTMFVDLLHNCKGFKTESLKQGIVGGAGPPEQLIKDMHNILKIPHIHVGYGATETSPALTINTLDNDFDDIVKGLMPLLDYVEIKIIDDKNHLVPINTQGELCSRGHTRFLGYWNDEQKTAEVVDKTNWYHTGDLAVMNEYGAVKIVGRKKDMIIRGGENIYPLEVENFLSTHPAVLETHICGVPDERMGEEACAWICVKDDMKLSVNDVKEFCKGKISHYKIPRYIMFVNEFPKTQSGKVKKFEMTRISTEKLKL